MMLILRFQLTFWIILLRLRLDTLILGFRSFAKQIHHMSGHLVKVLLVRLPKIKWQLQNVDNLLLVLTFSFALFFIPWALNCSIGIELVSDELFRKMILFCYLWIFPSGRSVSYLKSAAPRGKQVAWLPFSPIKRWVRCLIKLVRL